MLKQKVLGLTLVAAAALLGGGGIAHATASECGIGGTWFGHDPGTGLRWLGMHTPGTSATTGQIGIEWSFVDPSFRGQFPATQMTAGKGAWEKVKQGSYTYTWYAYGQMQAPSPMPAWMMVPVYVLRISGTATMPTCDHKDITYKAEFFSLDMTTLYHTASGISTEDRVPLVVTP
jgi:hypothetical protein